MEGKEPSHPRPPYGVAGGTVVVAGGDNEPVRSLRFLIRSFTPPGSSLGKAEIINVLLEIVYL